MPLHPVNPTLEHDGNDVDPLYHFGFDFDRETYRKMFGDVKFVCTGGSGKRMDVLAQSIYSELIGVIAIPVSPINLSKTDRYVMYKVGPVLCVNHGIGIPSLSIVLHEIFKLLYYAGCKEVTLFRCGTCGGIGVDPGTVIVTERALNGLGLQQYDQAILGKSVAKPAILDSAVASELVSYGKGRDFHVVAGNTVSTEGFYEEQARMNGFIRTYSEDDTKAFLQRIHTEWGVKNFEMEAVCIGALTHAVGIKAAVVCVAIVDRLRCETAEHHPDWEQRPAQLIIEYIKNHL